MHLRAQIRTALAALLQGLPSTGTRVYQSRSLPVDPAHLGGPCLLVWCGAEQIDQTLAGAPQLRRQVEVTARIVAKDTASLEDVLDQAIAEVEAAIAAQFTVGGLIPAGLRLDRIDTGIDQSLERPVGMAQLTWRGEYYTQRGNPHQSA
ncbi:hypothetical protein N8I74_11070 [Chitiniphilus purpureus]|uniref:DUF3168 domain-containing protein n=1 Tax=Chitiniphilus purpureus TaxID=2981137 RepID=A0ABY6DI07_9NEIS|nr:hypothetical protein [Chitiniphilus sp. CD1]UXY13863.1 hypothetical protein N8I74_11070 [Chitiniphilus sp. CD1]